MAASPIRPESPNDSLDCPKCGKQFCSSADDSLTPRLLKCGHSVCMGCFQESTEDSISCPVCRSTSYRRQSSTNFDIVSTIKFPTISELCFNCEKVTAICFCKNCAVAFCGPCNSAIHADSSRALAVHKRVSLSEREPKEDLCSVHKEHLKLFCLKEKIPICLICKEFNHHDHPVSLISEIAEEIRERSKKRLAKLEERIEQLESADQAISALDFDAEAEAAKIAIKTRFNDLVQALRIREDILLRAVDSDVEEKKELLSQQRDNFGQVRRMMTSACNALRRGTACSDAIVAETLGSLRVEEALSVALATPIAPIVESGIALDLTDDLGDAISQYGFVGGPAAPAICPVEDGDIAHNCVILRWQAVEGATHYELQALIPCEEKALNIPSAQINFRSIYVGTETVCRIADLPHLTRVYFRVRGLDNASHVGAWSHVCDIATCDLPANVFAPPEFDAHHKSATVVLDPATPLTLSGRLFVTAQGVVLLKRGITLIEGSGIGYFEAAVTRCPGPSSVGIGIALHNIDLQSPLGYGAGGLCWLPKQRDGGSTLPGRRESLANMLCASMPGLRPCTVPDYGKGDVVGLLVDCRADPMLQFFVNGMLLQSLALPTGGVCYPALAVWDGQLEVTPEAELPQLPQSLRSAV